MNTGLNNEFQESGSIIIIWPLTQYNRVKTKQRLSADEDRVASNEACNI